MGQIKLEYRVEKITVPIQTIIGEFEYGSTFALYPSHESVMPSGMGELKWIQYHYSGSLLEVWIDDSFWEMDFFFEKFMTLCLHNLSDFGNICLDKIDISSSKLKDILFHGEKSIITTPLIGTIFKPYYHQTVEEKISQAERFVDLGFNVFKNDECYFLPKEKLAKEVYNIHKAIGNNAYFVPNISSVVTDIDFMKELIGMGTSIFMVDYLISGLSSIYKLKQSFPEITIWGHRIGYQAIKSSISMDALCTLAQLAGIDFLHVGTPVSEDILDCKCLVNRQKMYNSRFRPVFTKTTPDVLKELLPTFGSNAIYLACGYFRNQMGEIDWTQVKELRHCFDL